MAVIKVTNSKATLGKAINYITKEEKTRDRLISGQDCNPSTALEEMKATKDQFDKLDGRQYYHYVQSFAKTDEVNHEKAHEIGIEWAEKNFKGYEVLIATHQDKDHIHTHFIVNSVSYEDGKKFHSSKKDLEHLKDVSDKICEREGLSVIQGKDQINEHFNSYNRGKYNIMQKLEQGKPVNSYLFDTALAVDKSIEISKNKIEFLKSMNDQDYEVKWSDTNKNITFKDKEGHKVRISNLEKTFKDKRFSKEWLENEFPNVKREELAKYTAPGRKKEDRTRGSEQSIDQITTAEHESKNGVRKHNSKGELGDIEETIRRVEQGVKGNPIRNAPRHNEELRPNKETSQGIENEQPNGERDGKSTIRKVKSRVPSKDWELEL